MEIMKKIGKGKCYIIAEAGVNHNGNIQLAKRMIDVATKAGVDAIKFQTFKAEDLVTRNADMAEYQTKNTGKKENQYEMLKKLELDYEEFTELKSYCEQKGIQFLSTPHTEEAADYLQDLIPAYKIGSGDLTNLPFLEKIAKKGKLIILSTGMGTIQEVRDAVDTIRKYNTQLILMHCTTSYPCPEEDVNLNVINTLKREFGCPVGYSDHPSGIDVAIMAASFGAVVIEKHFTLDKEMSGPDHKASINPEELCQMIKAINDKRKIDIPQKILGKDIKEPTQKELEISTVARKSIIAARDIAPNTRINEGMLVIKRPATGIPPKELKNVIEKTAKTFIRKDSIIKWSDLK